MKSIILYEKVDVVIMVVVGLDWIVEKICD